MNAILVVLVLSAAAVDPSLEASLPSAASDLVAIHGEAQRPRIERGLRQAASLWRRSDGDAAAFRAFARAQFVSDPAALDALFHRLEEALEQLDGTALEANR